MTATKTKTTKDLSFLSAEDAAYVTGFNRMIGFSKERSRWLKIIPAHCRTAAELGELAFHAARIKQATKDRDAFIAARRPTA